MIANDMQQCITIPYRCPQTGVTGAVFFNSGQKVFHLGINGLLRLKHPAEGIDTVIGNPDGGNAVLPVFGTADVFS